MTFGLARRPNQPHKPSRRKPSESRKHAPPRIFDEKAKRKQDPPQSPQLAGAMKGEVTTWEEFLKTEPNASDLWLLFEKAKDPFRERAWRLLCERGEVHRSQLTRVVQQIDSEVHELLRVSDRYSRQRSEAADVP